MAKKKYYVSVREVHIQPYYVEAETEEDAMKAISDGGGDIDEGGFHYSHTLDRENWTAEEVIDNEEGNS